MKKISSLLAVVFLLTATIGSAATSHELAFPRLDQQLSAAHVVPGSALEKLIRDNQDFSRLQPRDAADKIVPPWLKVFWQKGHPEVNYANPNDPTGGYPLVLKEVLEWMMTHQDLKPGLPDASMAPGRQFGDLDEDADEASFQQPLPGVFGRLTTMAASAGTNVRVSGAQTSSRSESDIRINYWDPTKIISASNNIGGSGAQAQYYSTDGGVTWGQTNLPIASGDSYHSDPTVDWSSDGTAWSTTMGINGNTLKVQSYKSTNGGATWTFDGTISGSQTNTDKQMQWIDHSASSAYKNNNYVIWHNGNPAFMNRRTSTGWGTPIQVSGSETTGTAIGADVKTNSAGEVFGFFPDTGSQGIYVVKSTNGGGSYSAPVRIVTTYDSYDIGVPAFSSRRILLYVSGGAYKTSTVNNVYALWTDLSGDSGCTAASSEPGTNVSSTCKTRIWFARSTDGGATWSARVKINNQSGLNDQFNPFLAVDETTGTIGAIYYDTVNDPNRKKVDVFYQMSTDGGATWQAAVKVTTAMTDETASTADSGNQFGDYNSLSGYGNAFFPSWTDRRNNAKEEIWTAKISTSGGTTTYAISGSAGTSGATVSAGSASATSDSSNNYSIAGLAAGTYTVTPSKSGCTFSPASQSVTITSANVGAINFTASCTSGDMQLTSGVAVNGESVAQGAWKYYYINVPSGATNLTFATTNATADVDIYTQVNAKPTSSSYVCRPYTGSGNETCSQANPAAGTWWLGVYGYAAGSYTVTATVTTGTVTYSIGGSAGTSGATVTAGSKSATSDASNNYSITGLAAGTYTVTPSKSGCTFSPASSSVTITSANVTGINFTASCTATTFSVSGSAGTSGATVSAGSASATSDASNNYSITGLAAGTYTVTPSKSGCTFSPASSSVTITSANVTGINFTASCTSGDTQLTSGVALNSQSVAQGAWKYYYITVPSGATNLTFATTNSTGDVDIYTQVNAKPTSTSYVCRPYTGSGNETCSQTNPAAGTWWLGVYGYAAASYTVTATVTTGGGGGGTTVFTNGFESSTGWATAQVSGTAGAWTYVTSGTYPTSSPHTGSYMAKFNSYNAASGSQTRIYRSTGFAIPSTATSATLTFWMYHDTGYSTTADKVQVQVSTGSTWANVGTAINRYDGSTGWKQHTIDLTSYKGTTVQLGFLGISAYGNNEFIDDVTVTTNP